ncbi:DUF1574 domain-containing protein [Laspinema sp. A4]|nr:DUF1574 domain-containing protein [Laspinema sp. D2d]
MKRLAFVTLRLLSLAIALPAVTQTLWIHPAIAQGVVNARRSQSQPFPSFNSQRLDEQLIRYQQQLNQSGPPDILIVGSSRALQGVDPLALELALAHYGHPGLRIYNFSINGATAQVIDLLLRRILTPDQLPKLIIWADGVRAFNNGRPDRTYQAILESEGYRLLSSGVRPLQTQGSSTPTRTGPTRRRQSAVPGAFPKIDPPPPLTTNDDPREALATTYQAMNVWFSQVREEIAATYNDEAQQAMWIRRGDPGDRRNNPRPSTPTPGTGRPPLPTIEALTAQQTPNQMQPTGFVPVSDRYNPETYYQKHPRVSGQYDGDYAAFSLQGEQTRALEAIAQFTNSKQIPLVVVNLPLNSDYLDAVRSSSEQQFRTQMQRMATQRGFIFRDLGQLWPTQDNYFADPSHLNRYGAFSVAVELAADPTIPWGRAR